MTLLEACRWEVYMGRGGGTAASAYQAALPPPLDDTAVDGGLQVGGLGCGYEDAATRAHGGLPVGIDRDLHVGGGGAGNSCHAWGGSRGFRGSFAPPPTQALPPGSTTIPTLRRLGPLPAGVVLLVREVPLPPSNPPRWSTLRGVSATLLPALLITIRDAW